MNQAHFHLLITHLPIVGSMLGSLSLAYGIGVKSAHTKMMACYILILSALGGLLAYTSGEGAEEVVEHLPGVAENLIERHEAFAVFALAATIALGLAAVLGLWLTRHKSESADKASFAILGIALIHFALVARTGYLGGQIRHTEIRPHAMQGAPSHEDQDNH